LRKDFRRLKTNILSLLLIREAKMDSIQGQGGLNITLDKNLKSLSENETLPYLKSLKGRLDNLSSVLESEDDGFVTYYVNIIRDNIECFELKYQLTGNDKIDFPLTIVPENSGFPTEKDFFLLEKNKEEANEVLKILPERAEIIDKVRRAILRDGSYANAQVLLKRHNFYSKISESQIPESQILSGYHLNETKFVKKSKGRRLYTLEWTCIERDSKIPILYRMCSTQDERREPLDKARNARLETMIYQTQMLSVNLASFAALIDNEIEEIHPKLLERYKIGPFFNSFTENGKKMNDLLQKDENPSLLKYTVERVVSERVKEYGNWFEKIRGKKTEREIFGPIDSEEKIITSFRIKQGLSGKDEYDNPCRIYGVTKEGNITG
jgi:hypothetical protein